MADARHAHETPPTPSERQAEASSLGDLLAEVSRDISTLMRQEVELAKAELRESAKRAGRGAGLLGGAGAAGMLALTFLSVALWWGLGYLIGNAWSAVVVAVLWGVVALVLALTGKKQIEEIDGIPRTVETVKEIPETLKRNEENR
ncbi:phage holin family protein [Agromyces endophyticus]|uniref:phage holin family protein n=1 Tax=Agromyces sp. H17E-10 TaxID=2932244 RepID=UPI001FD32E40|nr:phage holin family protein [Agromyces sp. H17E-10]UOQ88673.1 phage holin family protein [Agromyces sp. H17E-10]